MNPPARQLTVAIISDNLYDGIAKVTAAYKNVGAQVNLVSDPYYIEEPVNVVIVDLDHLNVKNPEAFKEDLSDSATKIYIVCTSSFQRLKEYEEFRCFSCWENLLEREFFCV